MPRKFDSVNADHQFEKKNGELNQKIAEAHAIHKELKLEETER